MYIARRSPESAPRFAIVIALLAAMSVASPAVQCGPTTHVRTGHSATATKHSITAAPRPLLAKPRSIDGSGLASRSPNHGLNQGIRSIDGSGRAIPLSIDGSGVAGLRAPLSISKAEPRNRGALSGIQSIDGSGLTSTRQNAKVGNITRAGHTNATIESIDGSGVRALTPGPNLAGILSIDGSGIQRTKTTH